MIRFVIVWLLLVWPLTGLGQCTPDPNACTPAEAGLPGCLMPPVADTAYIGRPYEQVVQLNFLRLAPAPSNPLGIREVFISRLVLEEVRKLPPGLSVTINSGNPSDDINGRDRGTFVARDTETPIYGCARFAGVPTVAVGPTDSVEFLFSAYVRVVVNGQISPTELDPNTLVPGFNPVTYAYRIPVTEPQSRNKSNANLRLNVSPNPSSRELNLNFGRPLAPSTTAIVVDALGRLVRSWPLPAGIERITLDVEAIPAGVYELQIKQKEHLAARERIVVLR